ncbi:MULTISPECIES: hypothetical protein [Chryseobacterium]|uniref:Uncharacterized protein n=1 Tax=Chryseobacterium taihuense TaxID=1141221 RepID=A0A4U8WG04_9FLAO|nr:MULTISPECIES: hypothetical protein [Chryseobacterium]QQV02423.1 hypothetical protein I6I61_15375 [Chryseobacterium sp. FDAARGOS 1104]VFB04320.1 Uncharacterised protein [Chryseobacterium taihuense]
MKKTEIFMKRRTTFCICCKMLVLFLSVCSSLLFSQIYSSPDVIVSGSENIYIERGLESKNKISKADDEAKAAFVKHKNSLSLKEKQSVHFAGESQNAEKINKKVKEQQIKNAKKESLRSKVPSSDSFLNKSGQKFSACSAQNYPPQTPFLSKALSSLISTEYQSSSLKYRETFFLYGKRLFYSYPVRPPPGSC